MRLSAIAPLLLSTLVASKSISFFGSTNKQQLFDDNLKVPGSNPLQYCLADHGDDLIRIDKVDLSPNPPVAGQALTIEAYGEFLEDIEEGAYVLLKVVYGCCITLIKTTADLCEQVKNVDLDCPIKKGKTTITKAVELPKEIPPGKYTVSADVYTKDDRHITCLNAAVQFGGK